MTKKRVAKFRLQKVLEVREIVEKEKQKELSLSRRKLHSVEEELEELRNKIRSCTSEINGLQRTKAQNMMGHHGYLNTLTQSIDAKCKDITVVMEDVEIKRLDLLEASRNKKALINLKEKKAAEQKALEIRREQENIDEVAHNKQNKQNH